MADWSHPVLTDAYTSILGASGSAGFLPARDVDAAVMFSDLLAAATNIPTATIRYNRTLKQFEEWNTTSPGAWAVIGPLSLAMGGTGGTSQATAQTALGLGSMATQNANAVTITGGTISGINLNTPNRTSLPVGFDLFN